MDSLVDEMVTAFAKPSPGIKTQLALFISRVVAKMRTQPSKPVVKALVPLMVCGVGDADKDVRDAAAMALAAFRRHLGDKTFGAVAGGEFLADKTKMAKIDEATAKLPNAPPPLPIVTAPAAAPTVNLEVQAAKTATRTPRTETKPVAGPNVCCVCGCDVVVLAGC